MKLTTESVIEKCIDVHGDKYDYSEVVFTRAHDKVKIKCREGHTFEMSPSNHYHKRHPQGCPICSGKGPGKDMHSIFLTKAASIFGDTFEYGEYTDSKTHMSMRCKLHDIACSQIPVNHMQGKNPCIECYTIKKLSHRPSPYNVTKALRGDFDYPSYLYIVSLSNDVESFCKIGISKDVNVRIREFISKGYEVTINGTKYFHSCNDAVILENSLHEYFLDYSYVPEVNFKGRYECFNNSILEDALTRLSINDA